MEFKGVKVVLPAHRAGGARATLFFGAAHFQNWRGNSKCIRASNSGAGLPPFNPAPEFPPSPRGGQFLSKWVRAKCSTIPQKETSRFESSECASAKAGRAFIFARRRAVFSDGGGNAIRMHLRSKTGFVPFFSTKSLISCKLPDEPKIAACFVSKIHFRRGSTQFFLPRSKSFFFSFSEARERIISSFRVRYIGLGMSPSRYAETSFSTRSSLALIWEERF